MNAKVNFSIRIIGVVKGRKEYLNTYSADTPDGKHLAQIAPFFDGFNWCEDSFNVLHANGKVTRALDLEDASDIIAEAMKTSQEGAGD